MENSWKFRYQKTRDRASGGRNHWCSVGRAVDRRVILGGRLIYRFGSCELDTTAYEFRRGGEPRTIEPRVFELLQYLVENSDRLISKDEIIDQVRSGRVVSDSAVSSQIKAVRRAIGDDGKAQNLVRTVHGKGFRFVADVSTETAKPSPTKDVKTGPTRVQQSVRFCIADDGTQVAYAKAGSGPPLVKAANWLNHLEYDWESPLWRHVFRALAKDHLLIRYDSRCNGLSDWHVDDVSFEALVGDLEKVVDAAGVERFPLLGISQGCAISIAYAVRHPERVTQLVLYGGYSRGGERRGTEADKEQRRAIRTLIRACWGQDNPAMRQMFTTLFIPNGTPEQMKWYNDLQRITATPENAYRLRVSFDQINVDHLLPQVRTPTLVMHCQNDAAVPFDEGRRIAAMIPDARFVALEGENHLFLEDDPAWPKFMEEIRTFLST